MKLVWFTVLVSAAAFAQPAAPDACKLLKSSDVDAIFGAGFKPLVIHGDCVFKRGLDSVIVAVRPSNGGPASKMIPPQRDATAGAKSFTGSCDVGFSRPSGGVLAGKGNWLVMVDPSFQKKPDSAGVEKLASVLCSRL